MDGSCESSMNMGKSSEDNRNRMNDTALYRDRAGMPPNIRIVLEQQ